MKPDGTWMSRVVPRTQKEVDARKKQRPLALLRTFAKAAPKPPLFERALRSGKGARIIGELKRKSPWQGRVFASDLDTTRAAREFESGGAAAISVLTDGPHFNGSLEEIGRARAGCALPLLRKDFVVDEYQIVETRTSGASALLLVATLLSKKQLAEYLRHCAELGLEAVVQVRDEEEMDAALDSGAAMVCIDHRDPKTFAVDFSLTERLAPAARKAGTLVIAEGGISTADHVRQLADAGADAFLVGESLLMSADYQVAMKALVDAKGE